MPWNANDASRQAQQRFQKQVQQQQQRRFHQQNRQRADKQMSALMAQTRARRSSLRRRPASQAPARGEPDGVVRQSAPRRVGHGGRSTGMHVFYVLIGAMVALLVSLIIALGYLVVSEARVVPGTVQVGSNVRAGPGTAFAVVTELQAGRHVRVSCVESGWARLASPYEGRYIARSLLALEKDPKPC